jgi:hypothetical protein
MLSYINSYNVINIIDNEINLFKSYIDKIILIEENIIIIEEYLKLLEIILNQHQNNINLNYTHWLFFIESIFIHIDFINKINKKYRLNNMNNLIEGLSKKAADINVNLMINNKYSKLNLIKTNVRYEETLKSIPNEIIFPLPLLFCRIVPQLHLKKPVQK